MALWEYKVITSGTHGFASLALMETHLNNLGKDEWEIVHFQTLPTNALAFHGLARRSTVRDWTPPPVVAPVAARPSAYEPAPKAGPVEVEEKPEVSPTVTEEAGKREDPTLRRMRDTERDQDPDADEEEDWDEWEDTNTDELPTLFEAIKPHMRRNQRGPGMAVGIDYLAKRWDQREADLIGALKECGFTIPEREDTEPEYFEFEGDLYWVNRNNRGLYFINTREKPRPVFRTAQVKRLASDDPAAVEIANERGVEKSESDKRRDGRPERDRDRDRRGPVAPAPVVASSNEVPVPQEAAEAPAAGEQAVSSAEQVPVDAPAPAETSREEKPSGPILQGEDLLARVRPMMRRNRRGPGFSGSVTFLARALRQRESDFTAALVAMGLNPPASANDKPIFVEIGLGVYWMNKDSRGGIWINGRERPKNFAGNGPAPETEGSDAESGEPVHPANAVVPVLAESVPAGDKPAESAAVPEVAEAVVAPAAADEADADEADADEPVAAVAGGSVLTELRALMKANRRAGGASGEISFLSRSLDKSDEELLALLTAAGLAVPADGEAEPVVVEVDGEAFWLNRNAAKGSLWLNAKSAKPKARKPSTRAPRTRKPKSAE